MFSLNIYILKDFYLLLMHRAPDVCMVTMFMYHCLHTVWQEHFAGINFGEVAIFDVCIFWQYRRRSL